ncbi:hypothetical protein HWV62_6507 [Athelia sp. TMB]|nr:hypothetical protein HWV62_6507 [Athelia sp. TMB]
MDEQSASAKGKGKKRPVNARALSASEIARNVGNFETWSTYQRCEQASYESDIPPHLKTDISAIFNVTGMLPQAWTDKTSEDFKLLELFALPEHLVFLEDAAKHCPELFSDRVGTEAAKGLFAEIITIFTAWTRLRSMRLSKDKFSEADYAANVYNLIRSPAIRASTQRGHCAIQLPQPSADFSRTSQAVRVLSTKTAIPDCAIFIPSASTRALSHSASSPFRVLKGHPSITSMGSTSAQSSFRYQSTPCAALPSIPGFEFASAFFEDKKPLHQMLEDAYRQNRMSTASATRQLYALHIDAPVFGLVWSNGTVRAHVDWCKDEHGDPIVLSAPYTGSGADGAFHEWKLDRPSDILQVYFLIRNIDKWTTGKFCERVIKGVNDLLKAIIVEEKTFKPWRRAGNLTTLLAKVQKENANTSLTGTTSSSVPSPPKAKAKRRRTPMTR